jgi:hypothetical protein
MYRKAQINEEESRLLDSVIKLLIQKKQPVSRGRVISKLMDLKKNCEFDHDYKNRKKELEELWISVCERLILVLFELNENETESIGIRWQDI